MSLFHCDGCWDNPCTCGKDYTSWPNKKIEEQITMLQTILEARKNPVPAPMEPPVTMVENKYRTLVNSKLSASVQQALSDATLDMATMDRVGFLETIEVSRAIAHGTTMVKVADELGVITGTVSDRIMKMMISAMTQVEGPTYSSFVEQRIRHDLGTVGGLRKNKDYWLTLLNKYESILHTQIEKQANAN